MILVKKPINDSVNVDDRHSKKTENFRFCQQDEAKVIKTRIIPGIIQVTFLLTG